MSHILHTPLRTPTLRGSAGRAWRIDIPKIEKVNPGPHSMIDAWMVEVPLAHPIWHTYLLSLIHLRPVPGLANPVLYKEGVTHELFLHAMNIDIDRELYLRDFKAQERNGTKVPPLLMPVNFAAQFICENDRKAKEEIAFAVNEMLVGRLSPDTDYRREWVALFGDSNYTRRFH